MTPHSRWEDPICERLFADLLNARQTGQPASAAPWDQTEISDAQAYAVQEAMATELGWCESGKPGFWKSGGPSRTLPMAHALLAPSGVVRSGGGLQHMRWHQPAIEAEIALRLGTPVTQDEAREMRFEDCAALVDAMAVSIEIADSRWQEGLDAPAQLRLADSGSHGALIVGEWIPYTPRDWSAQACEVLIDGKEAFACQGTHSLLDPSWLLPQWLRHLTRFGHEVPAGTAVTTGSWVGALRVPRVGSLRVSFPGIGIATHTP